MDRRVVLGHIGHDAEQTCNHHSELHGSPRLVSLAIERVEPRPAITTPNFMDRRRKGVATGNHADLPAITTPNFMDRRACKRSRMRSALRSCNHHSELHGSPLASGAPFSFAGLPLGLRAVRLRASLGPFFPPVFGFSPASPPNRSRSPCCKLTAAADTSQCRAFLHSWQVMRRF